MSMDSLDLLLLEAYGVKHTELPYDSYCVRDYKTQDLSFDTWD